MLHMRRLHVSCAFLMVAMLAGPVAARADSPTAHRPPAPVTSSHTPWRYLKVGGTTPSQPGAAVAHNAGGVAEMTVVVDNSDIGFMSDPDLGEVLVVDLYTLTTLANVSIGAGTQPEGLALSPDGKTLYVADAGAGKITMVDDATWVVTGTAISMPGGANPYSVAAASNNKVLVSTLPNGATPGGLLQFDAPTGTVTPVAGFTPSWTGTQQVRLAPSGDFTHIGGEIDQASGVTNTFLYDAGSGTFVTQTVSDSLTNVALGPTGSQVLVDGAASSYLLNGSLALQGAIAPQPGASQGLGSAIDPLGTYAVRIQATSIDYISLSNHQVFFSVPIPASAGTATGAVNLSPDGFFLTLLTSTGIVSLPNVPFVAITSPPASGLATSVNIPFLALDLVDPTVTAAFTCKLDSGPAAACASPVGYSGLAPGSHTFTVVATDAHGDTTSDSATWTVIPPPPVGYWMLGANGGVFPFGAAPGLGGAPVGAHKATAIAGVPGNRGYWVVDDAGAVFAFGGGYFGGSPALNAGERITSISATPSGNGYWLFSSMGRVFHFGDAGFFGDMSGRPLNGPVLGSVATPDGQGYFMVASDGGIFAFGDAHFVGSMGGRPLNRPVVGLAPNPSGVGYWLVASDGGIFAFDSPFKGSMGSTRLNQPVIGMVAYGDGYLMVASDGGIFDFSSQPFLGSLGSSTLAAPIVGVASLID